MQRTAGATCLGGEGLVHETHLASSPFTTLNQTLLEAIVCPREHHARRLGGETDALVLVHHALRLEHGKKHHIVRRC